MLKYVLLDSLIEAKLWNYSYNICIKYVRTKSLYY